jgi:asparagine synthase (glutamine-hydrolysing)
MSGIVGLIGPHTPDDLQAMARRLQHRGRQYHFEALHDRLAVGAVGDDPQAMIYRTGSSVAVASGSVYSIGGDPGPVASQRNIAELLLRRFDSGGVPSLSAVDGDFAAAICQSDGGRVTLLRDYFGCMPLFWSVLESGAMAFASEYKAICALSSFRPLVDRSMLQYLQAAKRMPVGRTLLSNVAAARPGATLIEANRVAGYSNFEPLACDIKIRDEKEAKQVVAAQFQEALRRRSEGSDPLGLALSGGIDSIAMAFQLRSLFPEREIHTFTAGYGEDDPEMMTASEVAHEIASVHHPVPTPPSLVSTSLEKLVWHMEDPTSRSEALQLLRIGEVAAAYVPSLLSGQGADGLFAGMPRHRLVGLAGRLPLLRGPLFEIFDLTQTGLQPDSLRGKALAALLYRGKVPPVPAVVDGGTVPRPARTSPGPDFLNRVLAAGYQNSALQDVGKFERPFAASGVGYTSPCLDVSFARMAFTIDEQLKIRKGVEKYIFRTSLASVVPQKFRSIPKHPQRMRYDLEFSDCLDKEADTLLSPDSVKSRGFFEQQSIDRLRRRSAGRPYAAEAAMRLWTALATETWARLFLDNRTPGRPHDNRDSSA